MNSDKKLIEPILNHYHEAFKAKTYSTENDKSDVLMEIYGITPEQKRENRQYWGRELGMMWQRIVIKLSSEHCDDFQPALRIDGDEPCDLLIGTDAIDTKYRIGSGDSGTLKKFKQYGEFLSERGYTPILLILREDNLPAAITACKNGGWRVLTSQDSFDYLTSKTGINVKRLLEEEKGSFLL